jgi:hypothetical protein
VSTWESRMAARTRLREKHKLPSPGTRQRPIDNPDLRVDRPWLHGWPRIDSGRTVLIGTGVHCVCCGRLRGVTCVAFTEDWEPPGPDPVWPFGEADCPICEVDQP